MGRIDVEGLRLDRARSTPAGNEAGATSAGPRRGRRFLKGPVSWDWLCRAASLPGKALAVGIALHHLSGLQRGALRVQLSGQVLQALGVSRTSGYRGLSALEREGLVSVERHPGRLPWVTILDADLDDG